MQPDPVQLRIDAKAASSAPMPKRVKPTAVSKVLRSEPVTDDFMSAKHSPFFGVSPCIDAELPTDIVASIVEQCWRRDPFGPRVGAVSTKFDEASRLVAAGLRAGDILAPAGRLRLAREPSIVPDLTLFTDEVQHLIDSSVGQELSSALSTRLLASPVLSRVKLDSGRMSLDEGDIKALLDCNGWLEPHSNHHMCMGMGMEHGHGHVHGHVHVMGT